MSSVRSVEASEMIRIAAGPRYGRARRLSIVAPIECSSL
jgi:hypothetical protein